MFDRLDQARSLTGNQMKIVAAYGFGGIGKTIGPLGLALIVGVVDVITPKATLDAIVPSFLYFAAWMALCGFAFLFLGAETGRHGIAAIDVRLGATATPEPVPVPAVVRR